MRLTVLCCGTYLPVKGKGASAYLLEHGERKIAFDFGRGAMERLLELGISYHEVTDVFITHIHPDHCSELSSLLHVVLPEMFHPVNLRLWGPPGFRVFIERLCNAFLLDKYMGKLKVTDLDGPITLDGLTVVPFIVRHSGSQPCHAYRIQGEHVVAYSGDAEATGELVECCRGADVAILEATTAVQTKGHMTGLEAGEIAENAGCKSLVLTHVNPGIDALKDAKKAFTGPASLAAPLERYP